MSPHVERASESLDRCLESESFMDRFYSLLVSSDGEIRDKFANTDVERQKAVVAESIFLLLVGADADGGVVHRRLVKLGKRHGRDQLDIRPALYRFWRESLLTAIAEHDPEFSPELAEDWRRALAPGFDLLESLY